MVFIGSGQAAWGAGCVMRVTMHPTATTLHLCGWLQKFWVYERPWHAGKFGLAGHTIHVLST
jgi:hypothetical protein